MSAEQIPQSKSAKSEEELTAGEMSSSERRTPEQWLGITRDVVNVGSTGADVGINIARQSTKMGFGIATGVLDGLSGIGNWFLPYNPVSTVLSGVSGIVNASWWITDKSLQTSQVITSKSLGATSDVLGACGAKDGELLKVMGVDSETVDSLVVVSKLVNSFSNGLQLSPCIVDDLALIASLQSLAGMKVNILSLIHI